MSIVVLAQKLAEDNCWEFSSSPEFEMSDVAKRRTIVVPVNVTRKQISRKHVQEDAEIQIGVLFKTRDEKEINDSIFECESLARAIRHAEVEDWTCITAEHDPLVSIAEVRDKGLFTGIVKSVWRRIING